MAMQSWVLAGVGLVVLGCTLLLITARRRRRS
jgi:hypothetical protein